MGVGKSTFAFSNSNITINGGSTTINITRDNPSYSHKLLHSYGEIVTLSVGTTDYTWTPTADDLTPFFDEIPNQKTRLIDVYLDTYNGSTFVGRDVHALTVTLSEATGKPDISGFSVSDNNPETNSWGFIVYGESDIVASRTVTPKYGANTSAILYTYGENETRVISELIGRYLPLTETPTDFVIGCKVVDSRGFTNTVTLVKSCAICKNPIINSTEIIRCDADGNETESGTKAKVTIKGSWTYFDGKNPATLTVWYKSSSETDYAAHETISVSDGVIDANSILRATFDAATDYMFKVSLSDSFGNEDERADICFANIQNTMFVSADGKKIAFNTEEVTLSHKNSKLDFSGGKASISYSASDEYHYFDIESNNDNAPTKARIRFEMKKAEPIDDDIYIRGRVHMSDSLRVSGGLSYNIPVNMSLNCNSVYESGIIYAGDSSTNRPVNQNGWLETMTYSTDYRHQRYTTYTGIVYERVMQAGTWGSWACLDHSSIRVRISTTQTMTKSAAKLTLGDLIARSGTFLSGYNGGVKCNRAGVVLVGFGAGLGDGFNDDDLFHIIVYKNGNDEINFLHRVGTTGWDSAAGPMTCVSVSAGDVLYLYAYNQTGARGKLYANNNVTMLSVCYIS